MSISSKYSDIDWDVAGDEVVTHLRNLLRLDTRNPPGGIKVYGFAQEMYISGLHDWDRVHVHDERINFCSLQGGTHILYEVVARFAMDLHPSK